ncbi:AT-rich interactive domain-containing protein 3A-like isoform X2 [Leucoraja erinacea]|uniref:AT-rich interactive domain-containing protein 3A-like isoform X2 n=1 Tax=Leucoraja erinaceus TaxID=7782 RepID=UPI00245497AB|nr:AT-rich interactive domain-containing protein 3A-like isoform X2 [Leucoraja erinacea]
MKLQAVMENLQRQQRARLELEARQHQLAREHRQQQPPPPRARARIQAGPQQQQQIQMEQREPRGPTAEGSRDKHLANAQQRQIAAQQAAALAAMRAAAAAAACGTTDDSAQRGGAQEEMDMERGDSPRLSESSEALSGGEEMEGATEQRYPDPLESEEEMAAEEEEEEEEGREEEEFEDEIAEEGGIGVKEEPGTHHCSEVLRQPGQRRPGAGLPYPSHPQMQQVQDQADWTYEEQFKQLYELNSDPRRKEFLDDLFSFMQKRGTPVNRIPIMAKQVLDLYMLYVLVTEKGGLVEVINKKLWREITKGLNLPTSITSAAFTLRTQYMKYLYPYECEKRGLSSPSELQIAIDSNRREGRRHSFGSSLYNYSPGGPASVLSSPKMQVPMPGPATTNGSPISQLVKIKKEEDSVIPLTLGARLPISLTGHQVAAAQAAVAAQAVALDQLREKLESGEPPEKKLVVGMEEQQRLMQRVIQQNLLAMTAQIPMNIRINSQERQESALNLATSGMNSISMSVEINGVVYTGVLFGQGPGVSGASGTKGNSNKSNSSQSIPGLPVTRTPPSSSSHASKNSSP